MIEKCDDTDRQCDTQACNVYQGEQPVLEKVSESDGQIVLKHNQELIYSYLSDWAGLTLAALMILKLIVRRAMPIAMKRPATKVSIPGSIL